MCELLHFFAEVCKKKKNSKKKNTKISYEGIYLHDDWADLSQIWSWMCPTSS